MNLDSAEILLDYQAADVGYARTAIVCGASLTVRAGEIVGLVGPNGAGKSTLLKAVTGESSLIAGTLEVAGRAVASLTERERARLVGVVPQQVTAAFSFPALEFVQMGRHSHLPRFAHIGKADAEAVERAMRVTDTMHLAPKAVDELSGGDLQRLAFAQALAQEPRLLLLDEPVSHLDLNHRLQVLDLTRDLADSGLAVVVVFHELELAARYADRIAIIANGALQPAGPPQDVITSETLRSVFGVRALVGREPVTGSVSVTPVLREQSVATVNRGSVLVIGGSGMAAPLMRRLVLDGWQVSSGALNEGDVDATLADVLGLPYAHIPPFVAMDELATSAVIELASRSDAVVVCDVPFGHGNIDNLKAAVESGRPLVLMGDIDGRDYTGGQAEELWAQAVEAGAVVVPDVSAVVTALESLVCG